MIVTKNSEKAPEKLISKTDIIFAVIVIVAAILIWSAFLTAETGAKVIVKQGGRIIETLPLSEDAVFDVGGEFCNVIYVKNGEAFMFSADCPGKQCVKSGRISKEGQSIVCVPAGIVVTVEGGGNGGGPDAITG